MNTALTYRYRDADNYKTGMTVVLDGLISDKDIQVILGALDGGDGFIPSQVGLEDLQGALMGYDAASKTDHPEQVVSEADHPWHELEADGFEVTSNEPSIELSAAQLVANFKAVTWDDSEQITYAKVYDRG